MTLTVVDQRPRRSIWDLVVDHVEQRGVMLGPSARVADVIADMRALASEDGPTREGRGYLGCAYATALDFVGYLASELEAHGVSIDDPIDVRAPASARLVHVQAMLWDHVRTVVQLHALIEESTP